MWPGLMSGGGEGGASGRGLKPMKWWATLPQSCGWHSMDPRPLPLCIKRASREHSESAFSNSHVSVARWINPSRNDEDGLPKRLHGLRGGALECECCLVQSQAFLATSEAEMSRAQLPATIAITGMSHSTI